MLTITSSPLTTSVCVTRLAPDGFWGLIVVGDRSVGCGTTGVQQWGWAVLSIRSMTLGAGYRYLMESVTAGDVVRHQPRSLTDYYADSGTPPGVFLGAGMATLDGGRGVEIGSEVSEAHLFNLLGMCADPITGEPLGRPQSALGPHWSEGMRNELIPWGQSPVPPVGSGQRPAAKRRNEQTLGRSARRWRGSTSPSRRASRSLRRGPWPMQTRRR